MSNRKTTFFYALLIAVASLAVGMVMASRLGLSPQSVAQTLAAPPMNSAPINGPLTAATFRDIAKSVTPAVVNIRTESRQRTQDLTEFFGGDDLFNRFFGSPGQGQGRRGQPRDQFAVAAGTGFIIDKAGLIITNNHVVEGATKIEISLYGDDGETYDARIIGRDPLTDSALIELTQKPNHTLPDVKFGDSAQVQPGDWVMAIGNPFGLAHTVSVGVISANRPSGLPVATGRWADVLQTDAAINPGNSGGPLLNIRGEVVGMNTAIYTDARQQGNIGIGFAMPINVVRDLLPQLRTGRITRGRIGVSVGAVPTDALDEFGLKERRGALVATVDRNGPAAAAGLEPGDIIIEFNGKPVKNNNELVSMVVGTKPGSTVPVKVLRDRQERTFSLKVEELNLEAEGNSAGRRPETDDEEATAGFGLTLGNITPNIARELRLDQDVRGAVITDVEQGSPAARAGLSPGNVITRVNRRPVTSAAEASRELAKVESGGTAFLLVLRGRQETFVTITKE